MITKSKVSFTLDKELLEAMDQAAKLYRIAKSQLTQEAISMWLKQKTEEQMAAGYEELAKKDREYAEMALEAQVETFHE